MNKSELIEKIADQTGAPKEQTKMVADSMISSIIEALSTGEKVSLSGFGSFEVAKKAAKRGYNIATGEKVVRPEGKRVAWKASTNLKKAVEQ